MSSKAIKSNFEASETQPEMGLAFSAPAVEHAACEGVNSPLVTVPAANDNEAAGVPKSSLKKRKNQFFFKFLRKRYTKNHSDTSNPTDCSSYGQPLMTPEEWEAQIDAIDVGEPLYECIPVDNNEKVISTVTHQGQSDTSDPIYIYGHPLMTTEEYETLLNEINVGKLLYERIPLTDDNEKVDCDTNSTGYTMPMTAEEKHIIEELLAGCSPTMQRIVNSHDLFTIPPPSNEKESDEEDSSEEKSDEEEGNSSKESDEDGSSEEESAKLIKIDSSEESEKKDSSGEESDEDTSGIEIDGDEVTCQNVVSQDSGDHDSQSSASSQHLEPSTDDDIANPKLVIPDLRYCDHMIQQHYPLISFDDTYNEKLEVSSERQQPELENADAEIPKRVPKKPSRFKRFTNYLGKKLHFTRKTKYYHQS